MAKKKSVKESDIIQCQHYLAVTGWEVAHMAVLIGGQELRTYIIPRDQRMIDGIINIETDFWRCVEEDRPPSMLYAHRSAVDVIKRMYPGTNGETVVLPERATEIKKELDELSSIKRGAKKRIEALNTEIKEMLGEGAIGLLPGGGGGWRRKLVERAGYEVKPMSFYDVRFSKKAGD